MKKSKLRNQNGITLIILMIMVLVIAILAGVAIRNIDTGTDIRNYNYMCADIELLESKIMTYYNNNSSIPTTGTAFNAKTTLGSQASSKDNDNYYQIDLNQIYNITLNYGGGTQANGDIYIVNEKTHNVYYLKGILLENTRYYRSKTASEENNSSANIIDMQLRIVHTTTPIPVDGIKIKEIKEEAPIPVGFYYVGGTKNTGVVISDNPNDENKGDGHDVVLEGNQFVWVPVVQNQKLQIAASSEEKITGVEIKDPLGNAITKDVDGNTIAPDDTAYTVEVNPTLNGTYTVTVNTATNTIEKTIEISTLYAQDFFGTTDRPYVDSTIATYSSSVNAYGGFYIARYEAGCENPRTSADAELTTVYSKKNMYPYIYVTRQQAIDKSSEMYTKDSVTSALVNTGAWDRTLNWLLETEAATRDEICTDSTGWGNYLTSNFNFVGKYSTNKGKNYLEASTLKPENKVWLLGTGVSSYTKKNNIYDLAGNCIEWTPASIKGYGYWIVYKGGNYINFTKGKAAKDWSWEAGEYAREHAAFRVTLYIK